MVLTGAGFSAESGLDTFRGSGGLWENQPVQQLATPEAFADDPDKVYRFYNARRAQLNAVAPNPAHWALAELEQNWLGEFMLVSQNVDDLHQRAGSVRLRSMHGELRRVRYTASAEIFTAPDTFDAQQRCPCCDAPGRLRPHIVWFGEVPFFMEEISAALSACDIFVAIGTSGNVYPAAGFVASASQSGAQTLEINAEQTDTSSVFDLHWQGLASERVPELTRMLLKSP